MRSVHLSWVFALAWLAAGCANVTAIPVKPGSNVSGIRIYDVKPLLVVTGANVSLLMVPNYNRAYALRFSAFLAKHDFETEFQNGFLAKLQSNQDTTAVPIALINLVQEAVKIGRPIGTAFSGQADGGSGNRFGVYDIVFDEEGNLLGLRPLVSDSTLLKVPSVAMLSVPPPVNDKPVDLN